MKTKRQLEIEKKQESERKYWDTLENIGDTNPEKVVELIQMSGRTMQQVQQDFESLKAGVLRRI